jgi:predicted AlkP superfamily phosphohydrolase/phosphomutase
VAGVTDHPRAASGRVAIIGLDGATYRVLDPLCKAGVMPALTRLRERSAEAILRSTVPAYTPPAWVSMATGVNPGRHGVMGFLANTPQEPPRITHSGLIGAPPIWRYLSEQGASAGIFNLPMSYPPMPVDGGWMVSGGLAAGWTDPEMPNFASDPDLGRLIVESCGGRYPLDTVVSYEKDWRSPETLARIEHVQRTRRRALQVVLDRTDPRFLFAVFEGPDRLQHVAYQYFVDCSDWYGRPEAPTVRDRVHAYFAELDRAIDDLVSWAGSDGHAMIVSDHGSGPWEKTVNMNLLLERWGYLKLPSVSHLTRLKLVSGVGQNIARRVLPRRLLHKVKARVGVSIAWPETRAFSSHVAEQGIHVNEKGALPKGIVDPAQTGQIERELLERLQELVDPADGKPVVDEVVRREQAMHGPFTQRAPHLFPFFRGQRYELSDTLAASSPITDHRDRPWGYHHNDGVFIAAGPGVSPGPFAAGLDIVDVLPTAFHLGGLAVPVGLDGKVVQGILAGAAATRAIETTDAGLTQERTEENPFSPQEEAEIEESLRGLGYIE